MLTLLALALLLAVAPGEHLQASEQPSSGCADPPAWIRLGGRQVLEIRMTPGAQDLQQFVRRGDRRLAQLADTYAVKPEQIVVREEPPYSLLGIAQADGSFQQVMAVDDRAGVCFGVSRQELAGRYRDQVEAAIRTYRINQTPASWLRGTSLALLALGLYVLWLRGQLAGNSRVRRWIANPANPIIGGVSIGGNQLLESGQLRGVIQLARSAIHWGLLALISYLLIPLVLGFFPPTQELAEGLRGQILALVQGFVQGGINAIPDLLSILVILGLTTLLIRGSNAWFRAVNLGRLKIPGFYPEWAQPTARLINLAILLGGLAISYPYIPGSGSKAFQGAGLFLGVLAALGSSAVATNIISGLMLIYTRAFQVGDRVEINGVVGVVQDRALLVTRLQTPRNELVSIPNATVISASILNYSFSRREIQRPVALATTITIGYDVPWRQVHELMLAAAASTQGITREVKPFVLQTSLNDFHISYELSAFVADASTYRETLSELLGAIQDQFAAADIEILSPGYHAIRNGNPSTVPKPDGARTGGS